MRNDVEDILKTDFEGSDLNVRNQTPENSDIVENVNLQTGGYASYSHNRNFSLDVCQG